jgi:hypothetical protein
MDPMVSCVVLVYSSSLRSLTPSNLGLEKKVATLSDKALRSQEVSSIFPSQSALISEADGNRSGLRSPQLQTPALTALSEWYLDLHCSYQLC